MKKFLILFLIFSFFNINSFANEVGKGELILNKGVVDFFIKYIRGERGKKPGFFLVTKSSNWADYYYCNELNCRATGFETKNCKDQMIKRLGFGEDCFVFAEGRAIVWDNGNNLVLANKVIQSQWSDNRIQEKLKELGFFGDTSINKSLNKSENSELKFNKDDPKKIINDLKKITEMYQKGLLTKEEFEKSKNILLK